MIIETLEECTSKAGGDKEKMQKFADEVVPKFLTPLNKLATDNGNGFMVGNSLTIADIMVYTQVKALASGAVSVVAKDYIEKNQPGLWKVFQKVGALDKVKEFHTKFDPK
eukprot:TRINITY_DN14493_c0_g1_i1.p1 TRINITY_DN14493_c0_g1~~TRINITY_DN14493_c0_g1_i1.p1  ORF type:complete len:110 (-),score=10.95 TRINITY_DN14493_c0_g1_i1:38-367(-)